MIKIWSMEMDAMPYAKHKLVFIAQGRQVFALSAYNIV